MTPTTATTSTTPPGQTSAQGGVGTQPQTFLERLANQIGLRAGAASLFGAPIERDGVTVVPIARASWGFGGGGGGQGESQGSGGGGGANVRPVGYIEMKNGQTVFHPIYDPNVVVQVAATLAGALAMAVVLRMLGRLLRGK